MGIIGHSSVEGFFQEVVASALEDSGLAVGSSTEFYLVGLLGEFTKARISDVPLALRLAQSEEASDRVQTLKEIGDTSLYLAGFFAESFNRQLVDKTYYVGMGGAAYRELSGRMSGSSVAEVYAELAGRFPDFVDVLARIRSQTNFAKADVVSLYEQWVATRADWIEAKLAAMGVLVTPPIDDDGEGGGYLQ